MSLRNVTRRQCLLGVGKVGRLRNENVSLIIELIFVPHRVKGETSQHSCPHQIDETSRISSRSLPVCVNHLIQFFALQIGSQRDQV